MAAATGTGAFAVDFAEYLVGTWKRNLEWRNFGGAFEHMRSSNTIVVIEDQGSSATGSGARVRNLRWSFGNTMKDLRFGYSMQFLPDETGSFLQWQYAGKRCHGAFRPNGNVAILNFYLDRSTVTITYRCMDADTMAVSIVEVNSNHTSTLQYGNMFRLKADLYGSLLPKRPLSAGAGAAATAASGESAGAGAGAGTAGASRAGSADSARRGSGGGGGGEHGGGASGGASGRGASRGGSGSDESSGEDERGRRS